MKRLASQRRDAPRGFSLLEVLVVLAITSLLAGLLVPSLARARRSARQLACLNNVHSVMQAIHAYAMDFELHLPYGPTAPPPSPSNLYPVTGLVTSQLSIADGRPMGLGLLLDGYLDQQREVFFCPGSDDAVDAQSELAKVGRRQAISSYFYRHGSNTLATQRTPRGLWGKNTSLDRLGKNSAGQPIRALVVDQNFLTDVPLAAFGIIDRTNHRQRAVNAGYADAHAETRDNAQRLYTVDVGNFPFNGPDKILAVFEKLDEQ